MTKADIVNEIAKNTGIEKVTVQKTVEALMETVKDAMVKGNNVYLEVLGALLLKKEPKKLPGIFPKIQPLLFLLITFLHLNRQKLSLPKLNHTLRDDYRCQAGRKEKDIRWPLTNGKSV